MAKGRKGRKVNDRFPQRKPRQDAEDIVDSDMDDEIDAFHNQRDVVPLDLDDDVGVSDEDNEHPVFPLEGEDEDEDEDEDSDDDDVEDESQLTGLAAKIARQKRNLWVKSGGVEDETRDDDEGEENRVWGRLNSLYYNGDNTKPELDSSDDDLKEEEAEVLRLANERAKALSMADFGLEDVDLDEDRTLKDILKGPTGKEAQDETGTAYETIKKDRDGLSREEQMDIVYSAAPEVVGLLSELNDALDQLESKVNPFLSKVSEGENVMERGIQYMELKKLLLLSYCQAITFYLLLKSEGHPVYDHPVISRLIEIKNLLDKVKKLDDHLPSEFEDILNKKDDATTLVNASTFGEKLETNSLSNDHKATAVLPEVQEPRDAVKLVNVDSSTETKDKGKRKRQHDALGLQSLEMLKIRAALEEKLKQKGVFSFKALKSDGDNRSRRPVNGKLEAPGDFDDDAINVEGIRSRNNQQYNGLKSAKLSHLVTPQVKKAKVISGDADLPKRDDIGERRRKHELRVLAGAGIRSDDIHDDEPDTLPYDKVAAVKNDFESDSDLKVYKQAERQRAAKLAAKAEKYSRNPAHPPLPEDTADGKRQINHQMEKNRGLTRKRKKEAKNPRKKYKMKHDKAVKNRQGQVRDVRKPTGPYGGETSGINAGISRSVRLKN